MSNSKDAANENPTNQIVNYGTMETSKSTLYTIPLSSDENQISSPESSSQAPPRPAVRQRIQRLQRQLQEASAASKTNISVGDGLSTSYLSGNHDNTKTISELNPKRMIKQQSTDVVDQQQVTVDDWQDQAVPNKSTSGIKTIALPLPTELRSPIQRPYPKYVFFIVANEFCERFSYYGLRAILVLYFKSVLGFSDSTSTVSFHLFATLCFLTPVLGAIIADSFWGKFKTILYLSTVYLLGEIILVISSVFWDLNELSVSMTCLGLILIGLGTGGIKPCVVALGGEQFLPNEITRRENFFSIFYGAINAGALVSQFLTPVLRSQYRCVNRSDCYPFAFGMPCIVMSVSIVFFLLAVNKYVLVPLPSENIIVSFCQCSWLAFRRKLAGHKLPKQEPTGQINHSMSLSDNTSSSSLSSLGNNDEQLPMKGKHESLGTIALTSNKRHAPAPPANINQAVDCVDHVVEKRDHWLYLADDRFSTKSIQDFRSVWRFILIFLPGPVYWCLFDQQSSLWTLQATRMDGRLFGTETVIEPDQMSVANPVLLLSCIPIFQLLVYPSLSKCNLLTTPVQRMTVGGLVAALTFVASAMIEIQIQTNLPSEHPAPGYANILLVNGLSDCSIVSPAISYVQIPDFSGSLSSSANNNQTAQFDISAIQHSLLLQPPVIEIGHIEPLSSLRVNLISGDYQNNLNNYKFTFKLSDDLNGLVNGKTHSRQTSTTLTNNSSSSSGNNYNSSLVNGCPFDSSKENEFIIGPMSNETVKLLYVEQGNGKLTYKLFNDTLKLPSDGTARVRLLYEFFGSFVQAEKRQFTLIRLSNSALENSKPHPELQFNLTQRNGQVLMSNYIDVPVPIRGSVFELRTNDSLLDGSKKQITIKLKPGTRNLLIVHQLDAKDVEVKHEILQDNEYKISILYQLIPYLMISISEIMYSISAMELAYEMAPESMKSIVLSLGSLTVALGNILTVAVEAAHPFTNVVHDFIFYACLMALDITVFAIVGYYYAPHRCHQSEESRMLKNNEDSGGGRVSGSKRSNGK